MPRTYLIILVVIIVGCKSENTQTKNKVVTSNAKIPEFNADSAYSFVEKQVSFGPRSLSSQGWEDCSVYLEKKLKKYTEEVLVQKAPVTTYDQKQHTIKNIIASFSEEKNNRIVFFAHWDTRPIADHDTKNRDKPILGANDGGSGVGLLLELARHFSREAPNIGVDIILFDAEDYGQPEDSSFPIIKNSWCLGSQHWAKNPHKKNYFARYGILVDMVGAKDATFRQEAVSLYYAPKILKKVWKTANQLGYGSYFVYEKSKEIVDDHYYVNTLINIPTIDIIEYDPATENNFNKHWHTHQDDMENVDKTTLKAVGQTLLNIAYTE